MIGLAHIKVELVASEEDSESQGVPVQALWVGILLLGTGGSIRKWAKGFEETGISIAPSNILTTMLIKGLDSGLY